MTTYRVGTKVKVIGHKGRIKHHHKIGSIGKVVVIDSLSCKVLVGKGNLWQWVSFIDLSPYPTRKRKKRNVLGLKYYKIQQTIRILGKKPAKPKKEKEVYRMKTLEQALLERIAFIGDKIPESLANDQRPKFVLLGTPQELIDDTKE